MKKFFTKKNLLIAIVSLTVLVAGVFRISGCESGAKKTEQIGEAAESAVEALDDKKDAGPADAKKE